MCLSKRVSKRGSAWLRKRPARRELDRRLQEQLEIKVTRASDAESAVVAGAGMCLEDIETYGSVLR